MRILLGLCAPALLLIGCARPPEVRFACGTTADCAVGFSCKLGECRSTRAEGSSCVSSGSSPCGASGSACAQQCIGGKLSACLAPSGPVDVRVDPANCGECGRQCKGQLSCVLGKCACVTSSNCLTGERCAANGLCVPMDDPCLGVACPPGEVCRSGACAAVPCLGIACPPGERCVNGFCSPIDGCHVPVACGAQTCEGPARPDGTPCDDRNRCSHTDQCQAGACLGTGYSCTAPGPCESWTCAGDGTCNITPASDGTACLGCGGSATCQGGACGSDPSCPAPKQCEQSVACLPDGGCQATPRTGPCDDNNPCTSADTCSGGACVGVPGSCPPPGACESAVLCAGDGGCLKTLKPDGTPCLGCGGVIGSCDGGACTMGAGACSPPTPCQQSVSCLSDGGCLAVNKPNATLCDDGVACTHSETCADGGCAGTSYTCPPPNQCQGSNSCDGLGGCVSVQRPVGTGCNDGLACTAGDTCNAAGACAGVAYSCGPPGQCEEAVVCAGDGGCLRSIKDAGTPCNDGNACTGPDTCTAGSCGGPSLGSQTWYRDADGDGTGAASPTMAGCTQPIGYVATTGDCDDNDSDVYRTIASLVTDADNDGYATAAGPSPACVGTSSVLNGRTYYRNAAGGFSWLASSASLGLDCNDANPTTLGPTTWFLDSDGDTFGGAVGTPGCTQPGGTAANNTDCNDMSPNVYQTVASLIADTDNDGYGVGTAGAQCVGATTVLGGRTYYRNVAGTFTWLGSASSLGVDCYDSNALARPGQTAWFTVHRGDGSFDYACSTPTSRRIANSTLGFTTWQSTLTTIPLAGCSMGASSGTAGWVGTAPGCGQSAQYRYCHGYSDTSCNFPLTDQKLYGSGCPSGTQSWFSLEPSFQIECH